jgi:hypothetical protein
VGIRKAAAGRARLVAQFRWSRNLSDRLMFRL